MTDLGKRLRYLRDKRKMSIYDVEKATGLHFSTISKYERNERRPSLSVLRELAQVYQVPLGTLLAEEGETGEGMPLFPEEVALLRDREDLRELLDLLSRLPAEQVRKLTEFLRSLVEKNT